MFVMLLDPRSTSDLDPGRGREPIFTGTVILWNRDYELTGHPREADMPRLHPGPSRRRDTKEIGPASLGAEFDIDIAESTTPSSVPTQSYTT